MITIVKSVDEIPPTHNCQLNNRKCPISGKSDTTLRKVVTLLPGVVAYRVIGTRWKDLWFNAKDMEKSAEANRANEARNTTPRNRGNIKKFDNKPKNTWANLLAARSLYLEALSDHIKAIENT